MSNWQIFLYFFIIRVLATIGISSDVFLDTTSGNMKLFLIQQALVLTLFLTVIRKEMKHSVL